MKNLRKKIGKLCLIQAKAGTAVLCNLKANDIVDSSLSTIHSQHIKKQTKKSHHTHTDSLMTLFSDFVLCPYQDWFSREELDYKCKTSQLKGLNENNDLIINMNVFI